MLASALGDSLWSVLGPMVKNLALTYGPTIAKKLWDAAKTTDLYKTYVTPISRTVKDYTGFDIFDHTPAELSNY